MLSLFKQKLAESLPTMLMLLIMMSFTLGCGIFDPITSATDKAVARIDDAIRALEDQSTDINKLLRDLENELIEIGIQRTISNQVSDVLSRSIAKGGIEFKCGIDFVHDRVAEELERIKAQLLNKNPADRTPVLCQAIQSAVQFELVADGDMPVFELSGYNFQLERNIIATLNYPDGQGKDISKYLEVQTNYYMVLDLAGIYNASLFDPIGHEHAAIVLSWNNKTVSNIAIVPPVLSACERRVDSVKPSPISFIPPHTRGDREFDGHGPKITVQIFINSEDRGRSWQPEIYMSAEETKSDWTTARGTKRFNTIYTVPQGYTFEKLLTPGFNEVTYTDRNHQVDTKRPSDFGPASSFEITGDVDGREAGIHTGVIVYFNKIDFQVRQIADCKP